MITIDSASGEIQIPKIKDYQELMNKIQEVLKINDKLFNCLYFSFIDEEDQERTRLIPQIYDDFLNQESPMVSIGFLENLDNNILDELKDVIDKNKKRFKKEKQELLLNNNNNKNNEIENDDNFNIIIDDDNKKKENVIVLNSNENDDDDDNKKEDKIVLNNNNNDNNNNKKEDEIIEIVAEEDKINKINIKKENDLDFKKRDSSSFNLFSHDSKEINYNNNNNNNNNNNEKEKINLNNKDNEEIKLNVLEYSDNSEDNIESFGLKISQNLESDKKHMIIKEQKNKEEKEEKEENEENEFENNVKNIIESNIDNIKNDILKSIIVEKSKIQKSKNNTQHYGIKCNICGICPIVGIRYKCLECNDYDLCENCEESMGHEHPLLKLKKVFQQFKN